MDGKVSIESLVSQHLEGLSKIQDHLNQIILGKPKAVSLALTTLLARGHLLIEDVPGVGKTTLARNLAGVFSGSFKRIQFTSDLLPGDVPAPNVPKEYGVIRFSSGCTFFKLRTRRRGEPRLPSDPVCAASSHERGRGYG